MAGFLTNPTQFKTKSLSAEIWSRLFKLRELQLFTFYELKTLFKTCALASSFTQEIKTSAANTVVAFHHHFGNSGRIEQEGALHTDSIAGYTADGESGIITISTHIQNYTLKLLDTFAVTFLDFHVNTDVIARKKIRNVLVLFSLHRFQ